MSLGRLSITLLFSCLLLVDHSSSSLIVPFYSKVPLHFCSGLIAFQGGNACWKLMMILPTQMKNCLLAQATPSTSLAHTSLHPPATLEVVRHHQLAQIWTQVTELVESPILEAEAEPTAQPHQPMAITMAMAITITALQLVSRMATCISSQFFGKWKRFHVLLLSTPSHTSCAVF